MKWFHALTSLNQERPKSVGKSKDSKLKSSLDDFIYSITQHSGDRKTNIALDEFQVHDHVLAERSNVFPILEKFILIQESIFASINNQYFDLLRYGFTINREFMVNFGTQKCLFNMCKRQFIDSGRI